MNRGRRGIVLIVSILVVVVLSILSASLLFKSVTESNLSQRHVHSMRAFWLAETGVAQAVRNLPTSPLNDCIGPTQGCPAGGYNCCYSTNSSSLIIGNITYYDITSTGSITFPAGGSISRDLEVYVRITPPGADDFPNAIASTGEINQLGEGVTITGTIDEYATINFSDLFGSSKAEVRNAADQIYDEASFAEPLTGITWVDDADGGLDLIMNGTLSGSGILIIEGNALISGTVTFNGIIYVIGELTMLGNATLSGTVIAESGVGVDTTAGGSVTITYDPTPISDALNLIQFLSAVVVSWQEAG